MKHLEILELIQGCVAPEDVMIQEPMSKHTSFRVGGPADFYVIPQNTQAIKALIKTCREANIPYFVMGNGSNLLVRDSGFRGVIIQISNRLSAVRFEGEKVYAEAGVLLSKLSKKVLDASLEGFEFASGIPGTLGGAIYMNAGAYGGEMKDVLGAVYVIDSLGNEFRIDKDELELGYRKSVLQNRELFALSACLRLKKGNQEEIKNKMNELTVQRTTKQPLDMPSAGSTFRRPEGHFAGKLIMDAGLRGYSVGGAQVSEKHCGFVVNKGDATAADILQLIEHIQREVKASFGVELHPEVRIIGENE